jgi:hypothetical protein
VHFILQERYFIDSGWTFLAEPSLLSLVGKRYDFQLNALNVFTSICLSAEILD